MSTSRSAVAGATRTCPHCRTLILDSSSVCPQCQKYLRFDASTDEHELPGFSALKVEGTVTHDGRGHGWEYTMVLTIRDEHGEEVGRHVIGVGAITPEQARTFTLSVEITEPEG